MAKRDLIVRLEDVRKAISEIEMMKAEIESFERFELSIVYKRAFERAFEIIGEALYQIKKDNDHITVTEMSRITGLRHLIAHDYHTVKHDVLWQIATTKITLLKKEIEELIDAENMRLFGTVNPNLE